MSIEDVVECTGRKMGDKLNKMVDKYIKGGSEPCEITDEEEVITLATFHGLVNVEYDYDKGRLVFSTTCPVACYFNGEKFLVASRQEIQTFKKDKIFCS